MLTRCMHLFCCTQVVAQPPAVAMPQPAVVAAPPLVPQPAVVAVPPLVPQPAVVAVPPLVPQPAVVAAAPKDQPAVVAAAPKGLAPQRRMVAVPENLLGACASRVATSLDKLLAEQRRQAAALKEVKRAQQQKAEEDAAHRRRAEEQMRAEQQAMAERMDHLEEEQQQQAQHMEEMHSAVQDVAASTGKLCALMSQRYMEGLSGSKRKLAEPAESTPQRQRIRL